MTGAWRVQAIVILVLGLIAIVLGGVFLFEGFAKNKMIVDRMQVEKVSLAVDPANPGQVSYINNADDAQKAADLISSHRRAIAPTYQELLGGKQFDPTNPKQLTYVQAMNLENYLYMAVMGFGLVQVVLAAGAFMLLTGIALILIGLMFMKLPFKTPEKA